MTHAHRFDQLSPAARRVWAKSAEPSGHGLLAHMLDVAAVAEQLLAREPATFIDRMARALGAPLGAADNPRRALAAWVGLHDIGKATPGFQAKWPDGEAADRAGGLDFPARLRSADAHDLSGAMLLRDLLLPFAGPSAGPLANSVAAHHGYIFSPTQIRSAAGAGGSQVWFAARREIFDAYATTLGLRVAISDSAMALADLAWLAGLTSVSDWIGSNVEWFAPGERDATFAGHHSQALTLANIALHEIGWPAASPLLRMPDAGADALLAQMLGDASLSARPLQRAADELLRGVSQPTLLVVEAPMGEGKTELAFLAHLRLQSGVGHRGLYVALPTQATSNALFDRTLEFLRAFHPGTPLDLQLAHGGALRDERLIALRGVSGPMGDDAIGSSSWFSQRRRPLLSPYAVGTIDQALFATLNVKHHFVRLWGLANRVVVLDEVHAFDTYTHGLIEALLRWLRALGCSVILMSATLPRRKRDALLAAWGGVEPASPNLPYPRVLMASGGSLRGSHFAARELEPIHVRGIADDLECIGEQALALLAKGGCGAVIVNTVDRAQRLFEALAQALGDASCLMLFHARYPADERSLRERAVLATFGRDGVRPAAALLVATQVVEQSLDIDFDFLVSDLAPMDLLLQRAGRLHRHSRIRIAAHALPTITIAGLLGSGLPELKRNGWASVYDAHILGRTWAFATQEPIWRLPEDIDRLVQAVYGEAELPSTIDDASRDYIDGSAYGEYCAAQQTEALFARNAAIDARSPFQSAYSDKRALGDHDDSLKKTRLGEDTVTVVPVHVADGQWRLHPDDEPFDPERKPDTAMARRMLARQVRLSRKAVVHSLQSAVVPSGFAEHPWLRDSKPLLLTDGALDMGRLQVRLDPALGIVYRRLDEQDEPEEA